MLLHLHLPGHHLHQCCSQARRNHQGNLLEWICTLSYIRLFSVFVALEEQRADLMEATSAKSAMKALLTAFFTRKNPASLLLLLNICYESTVDAVFLSLPVLKIWVLCSTMIIKDKKKHITVGLHTVKTKSL